MSYSSLVEECVLVGAYQRHRPTAGGHLADDHGVTATVEELKAKPLGFSEVFENEQSLHGCVPLYCRGMSM